MNRRNWLKSTLVIAAGAFIPAKAAASFHERNLKASEELGGLIWKDCYRVEYAGWTAPLPPDGKRECWASVRRDGRSCTMNNPLELPLKSGDIVLTEKGNIVLVWMKYKRKPS